MNKIDDTIDAKRKQAIRRPRTSLSDAIIDIVENLILSQESDPGTHLSLQEIEMGTGLLNLTLVRPFKVTNVQRVTEEDKNK